MSEGFSFRNWYEVNGKKLNKSRRQRYDEDPDYRERVLEQNRTSRRKRRKLREAEKKKRTLATKMQVEERPWKLFVMEVVDEDGVSAKLSVATIGSLAEALGVSIQAVRLWEKQGVIPKTPLLSPKGDRLYSLEQLEMMQKLLIQQGRIKADRCPEADAPRIRRFRNRVRGPDGVERNESFVRVGALARVLGRTQMAPDRLQDLGYLPKSPFKASGRGYRLYTDGMLEVCARALDKYVKDPTKEKSWLAFSEAVQDGWQKLGVFDTELIG